MPTPVSTSTNEHEALTLRRHLDTFLTISRAIGSILDEDQLIARIMSEVTLAFHADRSTLYIHDAERSELRARVAQGLHSPHQFTIKDDQGLAGHVFHGSHHLLIPDVLEHPMFGRRVAESTGYLPRSMMVVPVYHRPDRAEGVLQVMHHEVNHFNDADLALLSAVAVEVGIKLDNARLYAAQRRQFHSFVAAFSAALDARDATTATHSINVANYAMAIGYVLGLDEPDLDWLRIAGLLHDVGKIGTPEAVLTKPGKLTDEEYETMKQHAAQGREILENIAFTDEYTNLAYLACAHHERLDGSGYPDKLKAKDMPLKARILAVADVWHALTQDRQYRPAMPLEKAWSIMIEQTPHQLDADCVNALGIFMGIIKKNSQN